MNANEPENREYRRCFSKFLHSIHLHSIRTICLSSRVSVMKGVSYAYAAGRTWVKWAESR